MTLDELSSRISNIGQRQQELGEQFIKEEIPKYEIKANREFFPVVERNMKEIYRNAADQWYSDYIAKYYQGNESLKSLLDTKYNDVYFNYEFDPERIVKFHNSSPEKVYEQLFKQGIHGGAAKGRKHPNEGTYLWRRPTPEGAAAMNAKRKKGKKTIKAWCFWGREAIATDPAYNIFKTRWEAYDTGELEKYREELNEKYVKILQDDFTKYISSHISL